MSSRTRVYAPVRLIAPRPQQTVACAARIRLQTLADFYANYLTKWKVL